VGAQIIAERAVAPEAGVSRGENVQVVGVALAPFPEKVAATGNTVLAFTPVSQRSQGFAAGVGHVNSSHLTQEVNDGLCRQPRYRGAADVLQRSEFPGADGLNTSNFIFG
jgi:hypothetical protein